MPEGVEINPTILFSTFNDWQDIYSWWWGLAKDKMKADKAIKAEVKRLIKRKRTDLEKARAIYEWVVENTFRNAATRGCGTNGRGSR